MNIRQATIEDLNDIMRIYDTARQTMRAAGNEKQWINGYPSREMVEGDIARGQSYIALGEDNEPHGVFMFAVGDDPTYGIIEDGNWLNEEPYGVIHRIGNDGMLRGMLPAAVEYCLQSIGNLRIDTHADNAIMHHVLTKCGFIRCGTIYCDDGTPRVAYHLVAAED